MWNQRKRKKLAIIVIVVVSVLSWAAYLDVLGYRCESAIRAGDYDAVARIIHGRSWLARKMLPVAYTENQKQIFTLLLESGADPDGIRAPVGRLTLLHDTARNHDSFWIAELLEHGANPNYNNVIHDIYPILEANEENVPENVRLLIEFGADVNVWAYDKYPVVSKAWDMSHGEIAMHLLEAGAKINPPSHPLKSFIGTFQRRATVDADANERDVQYLEKARQWLRDRNLDVWHATWDKSQGNVGVWVIPPFSGTSDDAPQKTVESASTLVPPACD